MKTNKWNKLTACVLTSLIFASFSGSTALAALPDGYTKGTDGAYIYTTNVSSDISGESGDKIVLGDDTTAMKVPKNVIGGYSDTGDVTGSSVTVNQKVQLNRNNLYGGMAEGDGEVKASQNAITITSSDEGISTEEVIGGYAGLDKAAKENADVAASNNTVKIDVNSASLMDIYMNLYGGESMIDTHDSYTASADSNVVYAEGVAIHGSIFGGMVYPLDSLGDEKQATLSASNNTVIIKNSVFGDANGVYGGYLRGYKGGIQHGTVSGNTLTFDNSDSAFTVPESRKGENTLHGSMAAGFFSGTEGTVSNNTITVNSAKATITGMIAGAGAIVSGNEADAILEVKENKVNITDTDVPTITGVYVDDGSTGNTSMTVTGNAVKGANIKANLVAGAYVEHENGATLTANVDENHVVLNNASPLSEDNGLTVVGGAFLGASGSASQNTVKTTDVKATEIDGGLVQLDGTSGVQNPVGKASGNAVTMNNSTAESVMGGGMLGNNKTGNEANGNTVTLQNGASAGTVIGGNVENGSGNSNGNTVTLKKGASAGTIIGGKVENGSGNSNGNTVTLKKGASAGTIIGGKVANGSGNSNENEINITKDSTVNSVADMYGGYTDNGSADNNTISITNGNVTVGSKGNDDNADDNIYSSIISGYTHDGGDVIGNVVSISGEKSNISAWSVNGGYAENGKAQKNLVNISGGRISADNIVGGDGNTAAESAVQDFVTGNVVNIAGGIITPYSLDNVEIAGAEFVDSNSVGEIKDNAVNLSGTPDLTKADLYGWKSDDGNPLHSGNTLNLGYTATMTDTPETRTITGSETSWNGTTIHGLYNFDTIYFHDLKPENTGLTVTGTVSLPKNAELEVSNTAKEKMNGDAGMEQGNVAVTINGTVLKKPVYLIDASKASEVSGLDDLYNNSKNRIQGSKQWSFENGGVTVDGTLGLKLSGNLLSYGLESIDAITYKTIDWNTNGTVLSLKAPETFSLANTKVDTRDIGFTVNSLAQIVSTGDYSMTLLDTNENTTLKKENLTTRKGIWNVGNGLTGTGEASLLANGNVIYKMDVTEKTGKPIVEATEETHNALIANEAAMSALASGRDRMEGVLNGLDQNEPGVFTFASIGGSRDVYDTGSQVKNYNWNGMVGVGNDADLTSGDLAYSVFYEYGKSHYDTDGSGFNGNGDVHYNGGGAMVKFTARNKNYYEASVRAGRIKNSASDVLHDAAGRACSYETQANYWGGHLGFGHIFDLTDETASESRGGTQRAARDLDVYGKYFHTHMGSDSFMADEVKYDLDSVDSDLLRIGVRVNNRSGRNNFFYGLAWDYEFDGESKGTVSAAGLSAPIRRADAGGSSAMLELGWKQEATKESPWDLRLTMRGFAGEHRGLGGNVYIGYHF